ncbi:hypothetical protein PSEUDO8Z_60448 [Pseudomonas sp. 8Z]|nr:hypothetical protein PSEUDO8Z_60448 [Pseudomonas sp. 8Z]
MYRLVANDSYNIKRLLYEWIQALGDQTSNIVINVLSLLPKERT